MKDDDFLLISDEEDEYKKILDEYKNDFTEEVDADIANEPISPEKSDSSWEKDKQDVTQDSGFTDQYNSPSAYSDELSSHQITFNIKGTKNWNTKEPYVINIDYNKLRIDSDDIDTSFYFMEKPLADYAMLDQILKNEAQKFLFNKYVISDKYMLFIFKSIVKEIDLLVGEYKIPLDMKNIFTYHLGPLLVYKMLVTEFSKHKYGHCYRIMSDHTIKQFLPVEYTKKIVLHWFEENINTLDLQFDNVTHFDALRSIISKKYHEQYKKYQIKIYELRKVQTGQSSSGKLLINKSDFFGEKNIIIFKRFVPRTIL